MSNLIKNKVQKVEISQKTSGQRLDNFLRKILKGVPHSLIYKIIRDGQVRVNSKRVLPKYRVEINDIRVNADPDQNGLYVTLVFTVINSIEPVQLDVFVERTR